MSRNSLNKEASNPGVSTKAEKLFYGLGGAGGNFAWIFTSSFLTLYYTDSVGISAAFVGTMMLVSRLLDGVSDIIMGIVIEKTNTRWGKARPWILFGSIPFAISLILVFTVPVGLSVIGKNAYVFISYVLFTVILYTIVILAYHAMVPRFSLDQQDRAVISSVRSMMNLGSRLIIVNLTAPMLMKFGGMKSQHSWTIVASVYAILTLAGLLVTFFGVKEKMSLSREPDNEAPKKIPVRTAIKPLFHNKYFFISALMILVFYISNGSGGGSIYYCRDVLGNANYYGIMATATMIPMLIGTPLAPLFFKKFGKNRTLKVGFTISIVTGIIQLLNAYNFPAALICSAIRNMALIPFNVAIFTFAGDIVDYSEWKTGLRTEGFVSSANSFGTKVGTGLGSALLGWLLAFGKYDAALSAQPQSAINSMIAITIGIPLTVAIVCFALLMFWDIDKYRPEIVQFQKERHGDV
ncbi:MAG: MFS transporter [Treponema sp.]|jgi:GPH family glycoside/pentoside/hexuronide:cation symporter|nr:MFS transporter [Treponema sp.]